jgi:hypothetical protein
LKFSKYLREFGIEPIIYTPANPDYPAIDESLADEVPSNLEVWHSPIWEPYAYYRKFTGQPADKKIYSGFITEHEHETLTQKISVFIRGNLFIPDARKFWIKPSVQYLQEKLRHHPVDLIISTGPPHSMHMIALGAGNRTPWIADFAIPGRASISMKLRLTNWRTNPSQQRAPCVAECGCSRHGLPYCVKHLKTFGQTFISLQTAMMKMISQEKAL